MDRFKIIRFLQICPALAFLLLLLVEFRRPFLPLQFVNSMLHLLRSICDPIFRFTLVACFFLARLPCARAVVCSSCYDQIPNCPGGANCLFSSAIAANRAALATGVATAVTLAHLLPLKFLRVLSRSFLESIKGYAKKSAPGTPLDWGTMTSVEVAQLPIKGLAQRSDSILELQKRLGEASTAMESSKLTGLLNSLAQMTDFSPTSDHKKESMLTGIYSFVWANGTKLVAHYGVLNTASLDVMQSEGETSSGSKKLTCVVHHPKTLGDFHFNLHVWCMILTAAGIDESLVIQRFILDVVYENLNLRNWAWQIVYFYFMLQLEQVETVQGVNLVNACLQGGIDTLKNEAIDRAEAHYQCIFRSKDPTQNSNKTQFGGGDISWNGKFSVQAKSICWCFNREKAKHTATNLAPDGTCIHRHVCDQWVSNNGPGGRCEGNHPRFKCDNPAKSDTKVN